MNVCLLYEEKDWTNVKRYSDAENIIRDLGLKTLFSVAARELIYEGKSVVGVEPEKAFLMQTMKSVMMVPLNTEAELSYRQEMVKAAFRNEEYIKEWFFLVEDLLKRWDGLGRKVIGKGNAKDSSGKLIYDIQVLKLFATTLTTIKEKYKAQKDAFGKSGFTTFFKRLCEEYSDEKEAAIYRILEDITFFTNDYEVDVHYQTELNSKIVLGCNLANGLKCTEFVLEDISTSKTKVKARNSVVEKMQEYIGGTKSRTISSQKNPNIEAQVLDLTNETVRYVVSLCKPFLADFEDFWEQLHFQLGFFYATCILRRHIWRYNLPYCYPKLGTADSLQFDNLKEFIMAIEQQVSPVGNSCAIENRMLLVITGANQGGKSTFLRSIGIAQIMMQCGLPVVAGSYESGLFPAFFTHFTRREDSAMNSGRLDEELKRMSQIVDNLDGHSLVLLNESFATTTEKEGSRIAYDIIKALTEAGVKVLTVTHLLSFAKQVYQEANHGYPVGVEFLSAERGENGQRTYRMVQHEPELTSFGMDLYEKIIENN